MYEYGCGSGGVRNISPYVTLENVVISVYYWDYLQMGIYAVIYCFSSIVDWHFEPINDL